MKKVNVLGFLSLLSLLAILGVTEANPSYFCFLSFLAYFRYFFVIPDELFLSNLQKACLTAFFSSMLSIVPLMLAAFYLKIDSFIHINRATVFVWSFIIMVTVFSVHLVILEIRESQQDSEC